MPLMIAVLRVTALLAPAGSNEQEIVPEHHDSRLDTSPVVQPIMPTLKR
jgi:hypothetical protein